MLALLQPDARHVRRRYPAHIPLTYLGATTYFGAMGLYLAYQAQTLVPATINYYRFSADKWKAISRRYRPESTVGGD